MTRPDRPVALLVAAGLAAVEGAVLVATGVGYGVRGLVDDAESVAGAEVGGLLIVVAGGLLLLAARGLARRRGWARSPVIVVQLLAVLVGLSLLSSRLRGPALVVIAVAVAALAALAAPASRAALAPRGPGATGAPGDLGADGAREP